VAIVFLLPLYFLPAEPLWEEVPGGEDTSASRQQPFNESALYAQHALLHAAEQRLKPERAGVEDLYFVGFAPYAAQEVFMKETLAIGKLLEERFDVGGREINLISHARVIDQFPSDRQAQIRVMLSESLKGVIAQTLCRKIGGGRVAALEVLIATSAISNLIREGKTFQIPSMMQVGKAVGMVSLNEALLEMVTKKIVAPEEAYAKCVDKTGFESALKRANIDTRNLTGKAQ